METEKNTETRHRYERKLITETYRQIEAHNRNSRLANEIATLSAQSAELERIKAMTDSLIAELKQQLKDGE